MKHNAADGLFAKPSFFSCDLCPVVGLILSVYLSDVAVICKTEISIVPNNEVFVNGDSHDAAGMDELSGDELVLT